MSVEVRGSAELLTSVPITGRMKNVYPDAASIASCLQLPTTSDQDQRVGSARAPRLLHSAQGLSAMMEE